MKSTCMLVEVHDKVLNSVRMVAVAENDASAIRDIGFAVQRLMLPFSDVNFVHAGNVDMSTGEITPVPHRIISLDSYKFDSGTTPDVTPDKEA